MTKPAKKLIIILAAAACLLTGCAQSIPAADDSAEELPEEIGTIPGEQIKETLAADGVFSLNYDPESGMNPIRAKSAANMQFWSLLYDSVFTVDENFEVSSEVITSYDTADNVWWVFHVDTDIPFTDGTTLTAADIVYSIQRAQQVSYYSGRLNCIYGISTLSTDSFAVTTKYANSRFPALLNIPIIKYGEYFEDYPAGSGPYMLSEDRTALVLNPANRHAKEMPLEIIYLEDYMDNSARITAFEDSSIDIVTNDPTGMYNLGYGSNETRYCDTTNLHYIGFNLRSMYFQLPNVRYAMNFAVDREYVTGSLMNGSGVAVSLPVHPKSTLYDAEYAESFSYDPEKSAALFEAAGIADLDDDGVLEILVTGIVVELNIKFIVNNDSAVKLEAARRICEELNSMGITTTLYELSWDDYFNALAAGNYDMYYGEIRLSADWNMSYLYEVLDKKADPGYIGRSYANCTDGTYTELYQAYLASDEDSRYDAFQAVSHYIAENAPIVPICFERREVLTHRGVVSGLSPTQYDLFNKFSEWTIDLK